MSAPDPNARTEQVLGLYLDRLLAEVAEPAPPTPQPAPAAAEQPAWRSGPFQALVFEVHALALAAPLALLDGVVPWSGRAAALPGSRPWELGVVRHRERNVRVVDTARIVLAGRKFDAEAAPDHLVIFDQGRRALACHGVQDVITLSPEAVQWRSDAGRRPWLAGTVRERLCALLDLDALADLLDAPDSPLA